MMALNQHVPHRALDNRGLDFFDEVPMIVTSSPIERDTVDKRTSKQGHLKSNLPWCSVLQEYYSTPESEASKNSEALSASTTSSNSTSFKPLVEHRLLFALENEKVQVLSQSEKILNGKVKQTKRSASEVPKHHAQQQEVHSLEKISAKVKSRSVTIDEVLKYEEVLKQKLKTSEKAPERRENGDPIGFIEKELGNLSVTPKTSRILEKRKKEQEKRLISLISSKKKTTLDSRQNLNRQLRGTEDKIKLREELELKQIRAAKLRQKALASATVFSSIHGAHQRSVAKAAEQKNKTTLLQKQLQSEIAKVQNQTNQMAKQIFSTLQNEQYAELREQVRDHQQKEKELIRTSEMQLGRVKSSYDERLKELKDVASAKAAESTEEKKEVMREISRIQKGLRRHFDQEFNYLLDKIASSGKDHRQLREEKASKLVDKILKADYVFDL